MPNQTARGFKALLAATLVVGCKDSTGPDREVASIVIQSGDKQAARAGYDLGEPFVVRVTGRNGRGVADFPVHWRSISGDGLLDGLPAHACHRPEPLSVRTDAEGMARVTFRPASFGTALVSAQPAGRPDLSVTFSTDAADAGASLDVIGGNRRQGKAGESLGQSSGTGGSLAVRVIDGQGTPVPHIPITWRLVTGKGAMVATTAACEFALEPNLTTRTEPEGEFADFGSGPVDMHGVSVVDFRPTAVGRGLLIATLGGSNASLNAPLVVFEIDVTATVIVLAPEGATGRTHFFGPELSSEVSVPAGTTVEWVNYLPHARIVSISVPSGGATLDSGDLGVGIRFQFVPTVPGTWEFIDEVSGASGRLIVTAGV